MIYRFRKDFFFLSNFYPLPEPIEYSGYHFNTSETAYMSAKRHDNEWKLFCSTAEPAIAKKKSHLVEIRPDWDSVKIQVMFDVVRLKFTIPQLREMLLATESHEIVEGNNHNDCFWGVDLESGKGRNFLGKILMKVRGEIRNV
jgi:ribA/ribD-fused uncharacterized protein